MTDEKRTARYDRRCKKILKTRKNCPVNQLLSLMSDNRRECPLIICISLPVEISVSSATNQRDHEASITEKIDGNNKQNLMYPSY